MARTREDMGTGATSVEAHFAFSSGTSPGVCSSKLLNASQCRDRVDTSPPASLGLYGEVAISQLGWGDTSYFICWWDRSRAQLTGQYFWGNHPLLSTSLQQHQ